MERQAIIDSVVSDPYQRSELWANPSVSIDTIRQLRRKASFKSFEGGSRVVIIVDCERMTTEAANALLKILEEPPPNVYFFLLTSDPGRLLPTVRSRCQIVRFGPLPRDGEGTDSA